MYCPLRRFTGIPCPLCGTTTAALLTVQGRLFDAARVNPVGVVVVVALAWFGIRALIANARHRPVQRPNVTLPSSRSMQVALAVSLGVCWFIRLHAPARLVAG